jgi:hypothetical protein
MERLDGNGKLDGNGNKRLGYGRLRDERCDGLAMDSLMATQWRWMSWRKWDVDGSATATATAMDGSVMDDSAMDGARAWLWTSQQQRDGDGRLVGNATATGRRDGDGRLD